MDCLGCNASLTGKKAVKIKDDYFCVKCYTKKSLVYDLGKPIRVIMN